MNERHPDDADTRRVMDIETTEHDREAIRLDTDADPPGEPGVPGARADVDSDDAETREASSHPLL
jgi:hypothetical protein